MSTTWTEFLGPDRAVDVNGFTVKNVHCGLCGNNGILDTRGKVFTPVGLECGVRRFCICPNGRAMLKASRGDQLREK